MRLLQQRIAIVVVNRCDSWRENLHNIVMEESHGALQQHDFLF
jgi:hypothetical protein